VRGEPSDLPNLVVDACHDLRTPLAAAYGFARTIERMGGVTGDNAMYLRQVIEATEELEQLIKALSAIAHADRGTLRLRPESVDLGELALQAAELSGHTLERDAAAGVVDTDAGRAVTSLAWLAAPIAEAPGEAQRSWHITGPDSVSFGPVENSDRELFDRDLRAYAGKRVLELLGVSVEIGADGVNVRFPPAT
jgi:signal transduction histidine kinase